MSASWEAERDWLIEDHASFGHPDGMVDCPTCQDAEEAQGPGALGDEHRNGHVSGYRSGCVVCEIEQHAERVRHATSATLLTSLALPAPDRRVAIHVTEAVVKYAEVVVEGYDEDGAERALRERAEHGDRAIRWTLDGESTQVDTAVLIEPQAAR